MDEQTMSEVRALLDKSLAMETIDESDRVQRDWNITGMSTPEADDGHGKMYLLTTLEGPYLACGWHFGNAFVIVLDGVSPPTQPGGPDATRFVEWLESTIEAGNWK